MSYDKDLDGYGPLDTGAIPAASVYQERWPDAWERIYRDAVRAWRIDLVGAINGIVSSYKQRLAALESAGDAPEGEAGQSETYYQDQMRHDHSTIAKLKQRLVEEHDKRVVVGGKLSAHKIYLVASEKRGDVAEAKLAEIRKLMPNMWDHLGGGHINVLDILDTLDE